MGDPRRRRSMLVYSATAGERWAEAMSSGADLAMFDLEDGTALSRKDEARAAILPAFAQSPAPGIVREPLRCLRINHPSTTHGLRDLLALTECAAPPEVVILPKVAHPEEVRWVHAILSPYHPTIELIALIEDQDGLDHASKIARASPLLGALFLGAVDLSGALGCDMSWDALAAPRATIVRAASRAGIDAIDGPWLDIHDPAGLAHESARVAAMGFTGKASYDVTQLSAIHAAFTPSPEAIDRARRIVEAVANSASGGALVDGHSVNKANAKGAARLLANAERLGIIPER